MTSNLSSLIYPEAYLHYKALLETRLFDRYGYEVPLGLYYWSEHTKTHLMDDFDTKI
jgi:hypothetical protein